VRGRNDYDYDYETTGTEREKLAAFHRTVADSTGTLAGRGNTAIHLRNRLRYNHSHP